jgi:hypothetical protein
MGQRRNELGEVRATHRIEGNACAFALSDPHHFAYHVGLFCGNHVHRTGFEQPLCLEGNKSPVLAAFDTLSNKCDCEAAS